MKRTQPILSGADVIQLGAVSQPWMQSGLPPVALSRDAALHLRFVHLRTQISHISEDPNSPGWKAIGSTVWVSPLLDASPTALAFDWALIEHRPILVVHNPLGVSSNLVLIGDGDAGQSPATERLLVLMDLVHRLHWQEKVGEHIPPRLLGQHGSAALAH